MNNKYIISLPRSGQHLTERLLRFYCQTTNKNFTYCNFYNCCLNTPCKNNYEFQKNHDFNLELVPKNNNLYLVLYRENIINQIEAHYRFNKHNQNKTLTKNGQDDKFAGPSNIEYSFPEREKLFVFAKNQMDYVSKFIKKWVFNMNKNILTISYEQILNNPKIMNKIINFFYQDDLDIITEFEKIETIKKQHHIKYC